MCNLMESGSRKRRLPPDQVNLRLGAEYIQTFNAYMKTYGGTKVQFIRDALDYWMSVDGRAKDLDEQIRHAETTRDLYKDQLNEIKILTAQLIEDLNRLVEEKDARIKILEKYIEKLEKETSTEYSHQTSAPEAVAEEDRKYQK